MLESCTAQTLKNEEERLRTHFKVNEKHVIVAFSGIHSRGHLMFHMKEITKKTKEMEVLPETKADYLLFDNISNVKGNQTLDLRNEKEMGHGEESRHCASGLCHTQNDADSTPQMTHRGALVSHATVILPRVQQKD